MTSDDDYDFTSTGGNYYQPSRWKAPQPLELPAVDWQSRWREERDRAEKAEAERDAAYQERNKVVAALAKLFPSGVGSTDIPGWDVAWHGCVYIDLPSGQVSWHFHDSEAHLFDGLPAYTGTWDGHDTPEKYARLLNLEAIRALTPPPEDKS